MDGSKMMRPEYQQWFERWGKTAGVKCSVDYATPDMLRELALRHRGSNKRLHTFGSGEGYTVMSGTSGRVKSRLPGDMLPPPDADDVTAFFHDIMPPEWSGQFKDNMSGTRALCAEPQLMFINPNQQILPISFLDGPCGGSCKPLLQRRSDELKTVFTAWDPQRVTVFRPGKAPEEIYGSLPSGIPLTRPKAPTHIKLIIVANTTCPIQRKQGDGKK